MATARLSSQHCRQRALARAGRKLKRRQRLLGLSRPRSTPTAIQWVSSYPPRQVHVLALVSPMPRRFQAYIDDLENNHGARVLFMGGIRPGHCSPSSEHPCGKALDVCQLRRGVVDSRCNLPGRRAARRDRRFARSVRRRALVQFRLWSRADRCDRRRLRRSRSASYISKTTSAQPLCPARREYRPD